MLIVGIDPGGCGALAFVQDGVLLAVHDMPVDEVKVNSSTRKRVSAARFARLLQSEGINHVYVERVGAMPREGAAGAFAFGVACGILEGGIAALGIPYTLITPQEWKKGMRCPADKGAARKRAGELFPAASALFARVKDDGRAEAAMVALYGAGLQNRGK